MCVFENGMFRAVHASLWSNRLEPGSVGKSGRTVPGSAIGSNPVKTFEPIRSGLARLVEPIQLAKWKITVYSPWFDYRFKSGQNRSNRFEPVRMCYVIFYVLYFILLFYHIFYVILWGMCYQPSSIVSRLFAMFKFEMSNLLLAVCRHWGTKVPTLFSWA